MSDLSGQSFFKLLLPHKAIVLRLDERYHTYEVYTFYNSATLILVQDIYQKPYVVIPSYNRCHQAELSLAGLFPDDFKAALRRMGFRQTHPWRYKAFQKLTTIQD